MKNNKDWIGNKTSNITTAGFHNNSDHDIIDDERENGAKELEDAEEEPENDNEPDLDVCSLCGSPIKSGKSYCKNCET